MTLLKEEARKALESALGGKKNEFDRWNKEIKKRQEVDGGGKAGGGGGWFGWGGRFGGSNGDHFWEEAQQASLAVLGIVVLCLTLAKGDVLFAVIFNPLLFALRGTRDGFAFTISRIMRKISPNSHDDSDNKVIAPLSKRPSAKENVVRKWASD